MALRYARWTLAAAVLAWAGVACSSSEGPSGPAATPDTTGILATVTAAESAFTSDPYSSFGVVLNGGVVASLTPRRTAGFARSMARLNRTGGAAAPRVTNRILPQFAPASATSFLPDSVLGKTFEYDTATNQYVSSSRTGAPSNGVRFILYALSGDTVAEPTTEVGRVDLIDLTSGTLLKLRVVIAGVGGTPVFFDETVSYQDLSSGGGHAFKTSGSGFIANAGTGADYHKLSFSAAWTFDSSSDTLETLTLTTSASLNQPGLSLGGTLSSSNSPSDTLHDVISYDFHLTQGGQSLRSTYLRTSSANGGLSVYKVYVNGVLFAQGLALNNENTLWTDKDGALLSPEEMNVAEFAFSITINAGVEFPLVLVSIATEIIGLGSID